MFHYKYSLLFAVSLAFGIVLFATGAMERLVAGVGMFGFASAFLLGAFYSSSVTGGIATVAFVSLGAQMNPFAVAAFGGLGAMCADLLFLKLLRGGLAEEYNFFIHHHVRAKKFASRLGAFLHRRGIRWTLPAFGAALIASPLPDELGVAILSESGIRPVHFAPLTLVLNAAGILALALAGAAVG